MASYSIPTYIQQNHSQNSVEEIEKELDIAMIEHPEDREVLYFMKAATYVRWSEKQDECLEVCEWFINESKQINLVCFAYWYAALVHFEEKKNYDKAIEYLIKMIELEPDNVDAEMKVAEIYMAQKKWDEALIWAKKGLLDESYQECGYEYLGEIYMEKKEYDLALDAFNKLVELKPDDKEALCNVGKAYAHKKDYVTAKAKLHELLAIDKKNATALYCIGLCWQEENDFYRAMDFYTKALAVQPDFPEVYNNIGKLYYDHEGDYKGAIGFFEKSIAATEDPLDNCLQPVYQNLSKLYRQMLETEKADYYLRKWYEINGLEFLFDMANGSFDDDDEDDYYDEDETHDDDK